MASRRVAAAIALALVGATLLGCGSGGAGPLASLQAMPEGSLLPPGSSLVSARDTPEERTIDGTNYADAARLVGTAQPASQVMDFYTHWLGDHGWRRTWLDAGRSSTEAQVLSWWKDGAEFRVAILNRGSDPRLPSASVQDQYSTLYTIDLVDMPIPSDKIGPLLVPSS